MPPKKKSALEQAMAEVAKKAKEEKKKLAEAKAGATTSKDLKTVEMSKKKGLPPQTKYAKTQKDKVMEQAERMFTAFEDIKDSRELVDAISSVLSENAFLNDDDEQEDLLYENRAVLQDLEKLSPAIIRRFMGDYLTKNRTTVSVKAKIDEKVHEREHEGFRDSPAAYLAKWITGPDGKEMMKEMAEGVADKTEQVIDAQARFPGNVVEERRMRKEEADEARRQRVEAEKAEKVRPKESARKKAVLLDLEGNVIKPPEKKGLATTYDTQCVQDMKRAPWLNALVKGVVVAPKDSSAREYLNPKFPVKEQGLEWFRPKKEFFETLCESKKEHDGEKTLTVVPPDGPPFSVTIAYQTNRGFIVQSDEVYQAERKFFGDKSKNLKDKVAELLEEQITPDSVKLARKELSRVLSKVAPGKPIYGKKEEKDGVMLIDQNTPFIIKAVDSAVEKSSTNEDLFERIASVIVFLESWVQEIGFGIFADRVRSEYFLPTTLMDLSPEQKLPEIFDDPRIPETKRDEVADRIIKDTFRIIKGMGKELYYVRNPIVRPPGVSEITASDKIQVPKREWKDICVNYEDIKGVPDSDIVFTEAENGDIYCLSIPDLLERFAIGDYTNPSTGEDLPEDFVERFSSIYNAPVVEEVKEAAKAESPGRKEAEERSMSPELAPGFIEYLLEDIRENEQELKAERKRERGEEEEEEEEEYDAVSNFSEASSADRAAATENLSRCKKCERELDDATKLKSIMFDGKKPVKVAYCSFDCFEESSSKEWPKREGTRSRRKTNGKKRSRKN